MIAVDLGSHTAAVWAARQGAVSGRSPVRRGRVVDVDRCTAALSRLVRRFPEPLPAEPVVVACRPLLTSDADELLTRHVLDEVFTPSRVVFLDSVRATAVGAGANAGTLLVADVGAGLTEVAVVEAGRVVAARRTDIGTGDLSRGATVSLIGDTVVRHVRSLLTEVGDHPAQERGMLLAGDGAQHPELVATVAGELGIRVHRADGPHTAALRGARLAAMSLRRHPAVR